MTNYDLEFKKDLYFAIKKNNNIGSIKEIDFKKINQVTKGKKINLLTYSFPCQDLSSANGFHQKNLGMKKGSNTRSGLVWEIERILNQLNDFGELPDFLLLENVNALLNKKHIDDYKEWLKSLRDLNYSTVTFQLNSSDYGSVQSRKRVYAISILNYWGKIDQDGNILDIDKPLPTPKRKSIKDILKVDYENEHHYQEALISQPNRTPSRKLIFEKNPKIDINSTSSLIRTLTTRQDRHPNSGVIDLKNTKLDNSSRKKNNKANFRFLTPREAYLLMGFEEKDYEKISSKSISKTKMYQHAGNSISIEVMEKIMEIIQKKFHEKEEHNDKR
ncbi:DNA (cytosine-5-)-methyltransferase [Mycoplasmopsis pulmonis]|uniref:DNA (cytosine-5-)-methyltransferase n=1 Tax=Mycoplasmopsis pulmonis TaxID=2107 RepID=UPI00101D0BF0|nr:DNA cytosine methyltransferase [Mycoplasmopsis pulmonis]MDZ7293153.1 DNA cytosine methyltransferase [Mycoplasmopsis pulmonis]